MSDFKEHILIGITSLRSEINTGLLNFAVSLTQVKGRRFTLHIVNGARPVDYARNTIAKHFLEVEEYDRLWFLDHDGVPPKNALDLLDVEADIATAIVPVWMGPTPDRKVGSIVFNAYDWVDEPNKYKPKNPAIAPTVETMDAGGCACMIIRREVLKDRGMWFSSDYHDILGSPLTLASDQPPPIFRMHYRPNGEVLLSEDLDFCRRAVERGYTAKYYTGTKFGHIKLVDLSHMLDISQAIYERAYEEGYTKGANNGHKPKEAAA